jgi:tetratricopeptide (TPR) repeat protein
VGVKNPAGRVLIVCVAVCALLPACRRSPDATEERAPATVDPADALRDVALPDLSSVDETVRQQAREMHEALQRARANANTPPEELALAYGQLGILLHAAEYHDAALPAYLNAQTLAPRDARWPYYLGHLYRSQGAPAASIAAFERALELEPGDMPVMVWLGRSYQEQGQPDRAASYFERALQIAPDTVAALAGLGQTALAGKNYARAVEVLEKALSIDPRVASIHSPLAMAYRGLGDEQKAESHLRQWRNVDILVPDPRRQELDLAVQSGLAYELRGVRALEARDFAAAAEHFRAGVRLAPGTTSLGRSLRHKLGTALALSGDVTGAVAQFEEVVRLAGNDTRDEPAAKAHYSLGVLAASSGNVTTAEKHLSGALRHNPNYLEARVTLGDLRRSSGRFEQAMADYQEALRINPRSAEARFGYAMALVRLNRYREARDWLEESARTFPERREFSNALARVLAAAPDATVRDGRRAMTLVREIFSADQSPDVVETMAMVAAELGDFSQAVAIQREVLEAARQSGQSADVPRLTTNLRLYEKGQPTRVPWPADHPVHRPGS